MHRIWLTLLLACLPLAAAAQSLVAARTIKARAIVQSEDLAFSDTTVPGALTDPAEVIGLEARVALFAGRPILPGDVGPAALIERNQTVALSFLRGPIAISTEGRALDRGAAGDVIRVMNVASRSTVTGQIGTDGIVRVLGGNATQP